MTRRAGGANAGNHCVTVAIDREGNDALDVAAGCALSPQAACPRPIVHLASLDRALECFPVRVCHHENSATHGVLRHDDDGASILVKAHCVEVQAGAHEAVPADATM